MGRLNAEGLHSNIAHMRREKGVTQESLALAVGVTRQTIIAMERGNYMPSVGLALKIANYFNTNVEAIFSYE